MRGKTQDTIWLLFGVILIFGTMAAFSPSSTFGKAFLSFRQNIENAFGGEVGYCPFINPYAMSIYSAGGLEITGNHPLCGPIRYAVEDLSLSDATDETRNEEGLNNCSSYFYSISLETVGVEENIQMITVKNNIDYATENCDGESDYELGHCFGDEDDVTGGSNVSITSDTFFASLNAIQQESISKSNKIAIQLMTEKRPAWQCFFIFGLLPFLITYYLLNDILAFAYFRTNTRRLIAIFASLIAILTGAFANLLVAVSSFVGLSLGQSFLAAIFAMAILAVLLGQITMTAGVAKSTVDSVTNVVGGALALSNVNEALKKKQGEN